MCLVAIKNSSDFASEVHLHILDKVASHLAPSDGSLHLLLEHLESYSDLGHFLGESVFP